MGVINNLIEIRRKFRAIVGANWDGTTLENIVKNSPLNIEIRKIDDTSSNSVTVVTNIVGFMSSLEVYSDGVWTQVGSDKPSTYRNYIYSLSDVVNTSLCRIKVVPYGHYLTQATYSNEFTVTRTEAQTASLKAGSKSKGADIFTESEADSIDVVKENIEKE